VNEIKRAKPIKDTRKIQTKRPTDKEREGRKERGK
jgi:hypothetical protein